MEAMFLRNVGLSKLNGIATQKTAFAIVTAQIQQSNYFPE
jgi:hypothetical protein